MASPRWELLSGYKKLFGCIVMQSIAEPIMHSNKMSTQSIHSTLEYTFSLYHRQFGFLPLTRYMACRRNTESLPTQSWLQVGSHVVAYTSSKLASLAYYLLSDHAHYSSPVVQSTDSRQPFVRLLEQSGTCSPSQRNSHFRLC